MNGSCVEFALKETSLLFYFPAAIMFSASPALTSAIHAQFADWPLRAGYLFMMLMSAIPYVMQFRISHVGSSSKVPHSGVSKDDPH